MNTELKKINKSVLVTLLIVYIYLCVSRLMWVAQVRAPLPIQYVSSSHGTLVPRGTFWYPCVPVGPNPPHYAPQSSTLPVSTSPVQLRAGEERSSTLASCVSAGKLDSSSAEKRKWNFLKFNSNTTFNMLTRLYLFLSRVPTVQWGSVGIRVSFQLVLLLRHGH